MIRWWVNLLPFCFVAWHVCRNCEVTIVNGLVVRRVTKDWYVATWEGAK